MTKSISTTGRVALFDGIRIVAFALVIGVHVAQRLQHPLGNFFGMPHFYFVSLGGIGVTLFLILSGMVLEYVYGTQAYRLTDFYTKRLARLYLPYWIVLTIVLALRPELLPKSTDALLANIFAVTVFTGVPWNEFVIAVSWFIGLIALLYLLFPLLSKWMHRAPGLTVVLLLGTSVLCRWYVGSHWTEVYRPLDWFPLCRIGEFGLGIWLTTYLRNRQLLSTVYKIHRHRALTYLSAISYPMFLIHLPVFDTFSTHNAVTITGSILLTTLLSDLLMRIDGQVQQLLRRSSTAH